MRNLFLAVVVLASCSASAEEPLRIERAAIVPTVIQDAKNPAEFLLIGLVLKNESPEALDELYVYIQLRASGRTVPRGERIECIKIKDGIEPGEQKLVQQTIRLSALSIPGLLAPNKLPGDVRVTIIPKDEAIKQTDEKLWKRFGKRKFTPVPYTYREQVDPALIDLFNIRPR